MRTLMQIQDEDAELMASKGDLPNFSKAGTGKTLSTLEAFKRAGHQRGLVICPQIALSMWEEEIKDWLGADVTVARQGGTEIKTDFAVTTYDLAAKSMRHVLYREFNAGALILDESHYLRRHTSKRTQAVYGKRCDGEGGFMENFDQVWQLTGTPIMRHHDDLWSQLRPLFPWILEHYGTLEYEDFVRNFCVTKMKKYHARMQPKMAIIASTNEPIINKILYKDIGAIRRLVAPDLPELMERDVFPSIGVIPSEYAKRVNRMTEEELLMALISDDPDDEFSMQHIWQAVALAKVKGVCDYLEDCVMDSPVLVGVWHNSVGAAYLDELTKRGIKAERVYGATPEREREHIRDRFNKGQTQVILGQMQAMGVSWNLQKLSRRVVVAQDHYSPGVIEQFYKRVYRTGQENKTYLDFMTSNHALDRAIAKMRRARERSQAQALD